MNDFLTGNLLAYQLNQDQLVTMQPSLENTYQATWQLHALRVPVFLTVQNRYNTSLIDESLGSHTLQYQSILLLQLRYLILL